MADDRHIEQLKHGVISWNRWRKDKPRLRPDLTESDLSGLDLSGCS